MKILSIDIRNKIRISVINDMLDILKIPVSNVISKNLPHLVPAMREHIENKIYSNEYNT